MSVAPYYIVAGSADLYIAAYGTAFPTVDGTPSGSWTKLGYTEGGVKIQHDQKLVDVYADQVTAIVKKFRSEEGLKISAQLLDMTAEKFAALLNNNAITVTAQGTGVAGNKALQLHQGQDVAEWTLLVRFPSPYMNGNAQYEIPMVVNAASAKPEFSRTKNSVLDVEFDVIGDPNASSPANLFGTLRMQTTVAG